MATSLAGVDYSAFAPRLPLAQPTVLDYFNQGQQAVGNVIDQQYQAQARQALLAQQQRHAQLDALLGPIKVQQAQANVAATTTNTAGDQQRIGEQGQLFPYQLTNARVA